MWVVVVVVLAGVAVAFAVARWPGWLPIGSDNDEYQLVGSALAAFEPPVVAGVEGTKYPLGYPFLLAVFEWLRLPVAPAAIALNLVSVAVTAGLVAWVAGRATPTTPASPGAALAAGGVVVSSVAVWDDAFSVMPEMLTLAVMAAMLAVIAVDHPEDLGPRLRILTVLAVAAVLLKTLAALVLVGGVILVALWSLWVRDRAAARGWGADAPGALRPLVPAAWATVVVLAGMLLMRPFPEHTTGYVATFFLQDPFDASQGRLGPMGIIERAIADVPATLANFGRAVTVVDATREVGVAVALVALGIGLVGAWRLRPRGPLGPFALGAVLAYTVGISVWPYYSLRFGVPLVPVSALGAGWLVRVLTDRIRSPLAGPLVGAAMVATLVATSLPAAVERGVAAEERLARQHAALEVLEGWATAELDAAQQLVSFDYREVAHHLDREVAPLAYTEDPEVLWSMVAQVDADAVVMVDIHHARNRQLRMLLDAYPDRFEPALEGDGVGAWRVVAQG